MEPFFATDLFDNFQDPKDFLVSNLNYEEQIRSDSSELASHTHELEFFFPDKKEECSDHDFNPVTKTIHKSHLDKKRYHNISNELRLELIDAVERKKEKIKHAAKRLGINYSSAKYICQIYKREGRKDKIIFKRKSGREGLDLHQNGSLYSSPIPSGLKEQAYNPVKQTKEAITPYESNEILTIENETDMMNQSNKNISGTIKQNLTLSETQLTNLNAPKTDFVDQSMQLPSQANLSLQTPSLSNGKAEVLITGTNHPLNQLNQVPGVMDPIIFPNAQPIPPQGIFLIVPHNYQFPYPLQASSLNQMMQGNQNIFLIDNKSNQIEASNSQMNGIPQNNINSHQFHLYPQNSQNIMNSQPQNVQLVYSPVFMPPPQPDLGLPGYVHFSPPQGQVFVPYYANSSSPNHFRASSQVINVQRNEESNETNSTQNPNINNNEKAPK